MPTYDYVCLTCRKKFSVQLSMTDHGKGKARCPKCGGRKLQQQLSAFVAVTSKKS